MTVGANAAKVATVTFVIGTCWLFALANAVLVTQQWEFNDIHAYLGAAQRIAEGGPVYAPAIDESALYRYSPWFAVLWIPFTRLPALAVEVGWAVVLIASTLLVLFRFRRSWAELALALLLGGLLYRTAGWGNVQPILVAALVYLLPTRAGPWVVGITASLKAWPLVAVFVYAWRREWSAVAISLAVTVLLSLPALFADLSAYPAASRPPNIYDATFLFAAPALLQARRMVRKPKRSRPRSP
jgi:glycosyl transferase family 87